MHRDANYYPLRNHLLDFLVTRSMTFNESIAAGGYDPRNPPIVEPGAPGTTLDGAAPSLSVAEPLTHETLERAVV